MFRKLHIQMTLFATLVSGTILLIMAVACLYIAENGTRENSHATFVGNAYACISHLETQQLLTHQWLSETQKMYQIQMQIRDNGQDLFYKKISDTPSDAPAFQEAAEISRTTYGIDPESSGNTSVVTQSAFFSLKDYYACTAVIPRDEGGSTSIILLYSLEPLREQILTLRISFLLVLLPAAAAFGILSWFFTGKLIRPLEENRKRQTEFIAAASHELRSPLTVIRSGIQAMEAADPSELPRFCRIINSEGQRMARLINDMLFLANADNQSWSIHTAPCELDTLLLDTYDKYESLMRSKQLHLSIDLPDQALSPCLCDASRISQVLEILLDNCLSYVPANGSIRLSVLNQHNQFLLYVSDNGPGIPDSAKESVFLRFYRNDASRKEKQHFGLGLCIAREIIHLHNGTIQITDTPGGGTTFTIALPDNGSH